MWKSLNTQEMRAFRGEGVTKKNGFKKDLSSAVPYLVGYCAAVPEPMFVVDPMRGSDFEGVVMALPILCFAGSMIVIST